jgi:exosortase/archaeosortase family protein
MLDFKFRNITGIWEEKNLTWFKGLSLFTIIILAFHLLYKQFEQQLLSMPFVLSINTFLIHFLLNSCAWFLNLLSIKCSIIKDVLILPNGFEIQMQYGCSGFQQFLLIIVLFLLFPGPWGKKAWFIPLSLLMLHLFNLLRLVGLTIYFSNFTNHYHFIHDWIFRPFIYFAIFVLWVVWFEIISGRYKIKTRNNP